GEYYINPIDVKYERELAPIWFYLAPVFLEKEGIFAGYTDGSFKGYNHITRAEAIAVLNRYTTPLLRTNTKEESVEAYIARKKEEAEDRGEDLVQEFDYDPYNNGIDGFYFVRSHKEPIPEWVDLTDVHGYVYYPKIADEILDLSWEEKEKTQRHPLIWVLKPEFDSEGFTRTYQIDIDYRYALEQQKLDAHAFLTEWHGKEVANEILKETERYVPMWKSFDNVIEEAWELETGRIDLTSSWLGGNITIRYKEY
ncbi:S-layer family protein, partial [Natranaerovirga hydrolytica]